MRHIISPTDQLPNDTMTPVNSPLFSSVGNKKNAHIIIVTYWLLEMSTAFNRGACAVTIHVHHVC